MMSYSQLIELDRGADIGIEAGRRWVQIMVTGRDMRAAWADLTQEEARQLAIFLTEAAAPEGERP